MQSKSSIFITSVRKRDGRVVPFDKTRIASAILRAMRAMNEGNLDRDPLRITDRVVRGLFKKYPKGGTPSIEEIQDIVEEALIVMDFPKTAKGYILYRHERAEIREKSKFVPEHVKKLAEDSKKYFRNELAEFIYYRTYSRWMDDEDRRETWTETVGRYIDFMKENIADKLKEEEYEEIRSAILKQEIMPSMRLLWSAGRAAKFTHVAAYNCSFIAPNKLRDFADIMYLLMCGTGVGFSVETQTVQQLPIIKRQTGNKLPVYIIEDSKEGWGDTLTLGLKTWFEGDDISFDYSLLRPAGARLKTMGGRSSGPEPLKALLDFSRNKILAKQGRRLSNLDVHDIICKVGEVVVMGGVRRSALISLSDLDDDEMRHAKTGQFYLTQPQRSMANNSAAYNEKPSTTQFMEEWLSLAKSGTGERGIFNRKGLKAQLPERRWKVFKDHHGTSGTNPCGEIVLRSKQFCNLAEVVAREEDTRETLLRKVRLATILGTYQATLTDFPYISKEWKKNCEEERLLGVSVTGQWDSPESQKPEILRELRNESLRINRIYAKRFGINESTCITCVKPSGTVSQLVDAASGMHPRHSKYYIRRIRISATDPLFSMLKDQKFPYWPEVGQSESSATTYVLEFPVKAPQKARTRNEFTAIEQLEYWKKVKENYTEHNPSVTISVGDHEWLEAADWLYKNWEILGGLSFLPRNDHVYKLAPYEEVTEGKYNELLAKMPKVDFSQIVAYEKDDQTAGSKELACVSGVCEIDIAMEKLPPAPEPVVENNKK
ncbi:MAG: ribonucleoside-triphosphate reductase [Candidatus Niyogibacteria bacterium CG10_big_fil_rev_8_21_14_0_10_42_19]|uniref:Ribonucleoside-triphosphate reductase n=1 Tax=Candidatus Niyogibacteria bacterium CG10_big_fil_rev_8_21_14_0_10_42_19 TaxID=1974725 RepID=A0A2H0TG83_9BACT|nr:MAG: ribonucleoside-triphosphate reductase [Candidatus Niyogibacteria bacterium CG10_big_fil_rev_8_21_14_0_10_42_19]